ncbi:hypothetical protein ACFE04_008756 [Oxalis oulophora]
MFYHKHSHKCQLLKTLTLTKRTLCIKTPTFFTQNQTSTPTPRNLKLLNTQITTFMRNGQIQEAQNLFDKMSQRNTVTWNSMVRGYFQNGQFKKAISFFDQTPQRDIFSYNTMISGLMQCGNVDGAREVFNKMIVRDIVTGNSMISGYVRNGLIDEAMMVFDEMPEKDVISWNLVIEGFVSCRKLDLAEKYFEEMNIRDIASWTIMISGFSSAGRIVEARKLFDNMPMRDVQAWNVMLSGLIENGCLDLAEDFFARMKEYSSDSWKILINGFVDARRINDAMRYFWKMPQKCQKTWNSILLVLTRAGLVKEAHTHIEKRPYFDIVSWTNMIVGYFESNNILAAAKIFESMSTRDATAWNVMICGLGENDHGEEGLKFFVRMKESGPSADESTVTSVLTICSNLSSLKFGEQTHSQVVKSGLNNFTAVSNAMITMYARCGNRNYALSEFSFMHTHDVISWNSIICGFAHHGDGEKALEMFERMILTDAEPNHITFVGVLSACSHAGLLTKGYYYFNYMKAKCFIQPTSEHYTCMADLLGKFGLIDEAMRFLGEMRIHGLEIPASVWGALLGACRIHKNIEVGEIAGEEILKMEPQNSGIYLIMAEMYLNKGRRKDAEKIFARMKLNKVKKQPGCSWIEVNNNGHVFLSGDTSHPKFRVICDTMDLIFTEMET